MALTKLYQVVELGFFNTITVLKTFRTEQECHDYLVDGNLFLYNTVTLTILPIWTNAKEKDIEKMLKGH